MKSILRIRGFAALAAVVLATGCTDLGLDTGAGEVTGLTIEDGSGNDLVTVGASGSVSGSLGVARNAQRSLRVVLRGPAGVITPGIAESIRVTVTNPGVATWTATGSGTGTLRGVAAGNTSLRVDLISAGSAAYTSPGITVQVTN
jgi:hypothetical protein